MHITEESRLKIEQYLRTKNMSEMQARWASFGFHSLGEEFINEFWTYGPITEEAWIHYKGNIEELLKDFFPNFTKYAFDMFYALVQPNNTTAVGPGEILTVIFCDCKFSKQSDLVWCVSGRTVEMKSNGGRLAGQKSALNTRALCSKMTEFCRQLTDVKVPTGSVGGCQNWGTIVGDVTIAGKLREMLMTYYQYYYDSNNTSTEWYQQCYDEWLPWAEEYIQSAPKAIKRAKPVSRGKRKGEEWDPICDSKAWGEPWQFTIGVLQLFKYLETEKPDYFVVQGKDKSLLIKNENLTFEKLIEAVQGKVKFAGAVSRTGNQDKALQIYLV